ncbi:hypothetical protein Tco_0516221 [Tanacetum coccineum]
MTTLHDLIAQAMQKKEEENRIAEEQAAKERYWKIPICDDDDDNDYTIANHKNPFYQPERTHLSLPDYKAFYIDNDHFKEKSSGSTTTYSDSSFSKYDSFIFDLSNDQFPPTDRSDFYHEEFADELAQIISFSASIPRV